jgi:hypothetical protein
MHYLRVKPFLLTQIAMELRCDKVKVKERIIHKVSVAFGQCVVFDTLFDFL